MGLFCNSLIRSADKELFSLIVYLNVKSRSGFYRNGIKIPSGIEESTYDYPASFNPIEQ